MINIWDMRWIFTTQISAANISNRNLHIKVQHFRFIWGCMDSPRVDRWDFLMVCVKRKHSTINKKSSAPYRCFFFFLCPLASKKQANSSCFFLLPGNRGCSCDDYFTSKAGCCCSFSIVPWYDFFSFYVILDDSGWDFVVCLQEFLESSGDFRIPQKKLGLTLKRGQWMIQFF